MKYIFFVIFYSAQFSAFATEEPTNCFKIGENWHDIALPNDMKNVRWLYGDDSRQIPFMSVTFNVQNASFESWASECGVQLKKIGKSQFWDKDIEVSGGFVSVVRYSNNRYCIGIERSPIPEVTHHVDGKPYLGCPLESKIEY